MLTPRRPSATALRDGSAESPPSSPRSRTATTPGSNERFAVGRSLVTLPRSGNRAPAPAADAASSHAVGEGLRVQVLQRPARFTIYACDRHRHHLRSGGDAFTVSIRGPSLVWPSIVDNEDGTYEVEWQATVSGVYLVSIMLDGEHIADSPWPARSIAPGADPNQCRLKAGTSPVHAVAGEPACFDVEFFDALGQGVAMEPMELEAVLHAAEACAVPVKQPNLFRRSTGSSGSSVSSPRDTSPSKRRLSGGPGAISLDDGSRTHLLVTPYLITLPGDDKTKARASVTLDKVTIARSLSLAACASR